MIKEHQRLFCNVAIFALSVVAFVGWSFYRNSEINRMIDAKTADKWTRGDMREWTDRMRKVNHNIVVPNVPEETKPAN